MRPSYPHTAFAPCRSRRAAAVLAALALVLGLLAQPGIAAAEPTRGDVERAQQRLQELEAEFATAVERYHAANEELTEVEGRIEQVSAAVDARTAAADDAAEAAGEVVQRLYRSGPHPATTAALLGAVDVSDAQRRATYLLAVQHNQTGLLERHIAERTALDAERELLADARAEAAALRAEREDLADRLDERVASQEGEISELRAAVEQAEREQREREQRERERERQAQEQAEREERERAQQHAEPAEEDAGEQVAQAEETGSDDAPSETRREDEPRTGRSRDPEPEPEPQQSAPAPSSAAAAAVQAAKSQIGKPYQWGASGPNAYDCSGLTSWAWRQAGVSIPRTSGAQYSGLPKVSRDQLQAGDLLFFGSPIHHVGMYIGGGQMVEAPYSGQSVRIASINRSGYVGAARPR